MLTEATEHAHWPMGHARREEWPESRPAKRGRRAAGVTADGARESAPQLPKSARQRRILTALAHGPLATSALATRVGTNRNNVLDAVKMLRAAGRVVEVGRVTTGRPGPAESVWGLTGAQPLPAPPKATARRGRFDPRPRREIGRDARILASLRAAGQTTAPAIAARLRITSTAVGVVLRRLEARGMAEVVGMLPAKHRQRATQVWAAVASMRLREVGA